MLCIINTVEIVGLEYSQSTIATVGIPTVGFLFSPANQVLIPWDDNRRQILNKANVLEKLNTEKLWELSRFSIILLI